MHALGRVVAAALATTCCVVASPAIARDTSADTAASLQAAAAALRPGTPFAPALRRQIATALTGTLHDFAGQIEDPHNSVEIHGSVRAPVPVPIISKYVNGGASASGNGFQMLEAGSALLEAVQHREVPAASALAVNGAAGTTFEFHRGDQTLATIGIESNPTERSVTVTMQAPDVKIGPNGEHGTGSVAVEYVYADNEHYLDALGITPKTLPGGATALRLTELVTGQGRTPADAGGSAPSTVLGAVGAALRSTMLPALAQDQQNFASVTVTQSSSYSVPVSEIAGVAQTLVTGVQREGAAHEESGAEVTLTRSSSERYTRGTVDAPPAHVTFTGVEVELSGKGKIAGADGEVSIVLKRTTDPDARGEKTETERALAASVRRGMPIMDAIAAQLGPFVSLDAIRVAMQRSVVSWERRVGGVRIAWNDAMLARILDAHSTSDDLTFFAGLDRDLTSVTDAAERERIVDAFAAPSSGEGSRTTRTLRGLTVVSLANVVARAQPYGARWAEMPDDLRHPGCIGRIHGFLLEPEHDDVLLLATPGRPGFCIELSDVAVAFDAVWRAHRVPAVSIDPDPAAPGAPYTARLIGRVDGVPPDSPFAGAMLDADYDMKLMSSGRDAQAPADAPSFSALLAANAPTAPFIVRFWFYPERPAAGDIELSEDGRAGLFSVGVQVLSERLVLDAQGLEGAGSSFVQAEAFAAAMTRAMPHLEGAEPRFSRLGGLFDLVLLAKVLQQVSPSAPVLTRLADLPADHVEVPTSFTPLSEVIRAANGGQMTMSGGVHADVQLTPEMLFTQNDPQLAEVRAAAEAALHDGTTSASLGQLQVSVADVDGRAPSSQDDDLELAFSSLAAGNLDLAARHVERLLIADPFDATAYAIKAMLLRYRGDCAAAVPVAQYAISLTVDDRPTSLATETVVGCSLEVGNDDQARAALDAGLARAPNDARLHLVSGGLYDEAGAVDMAREQYRAAIRLDPSSALAYAALGTLELQQGWFARAKQLIERAQQLGPSLDSVQLALAYANVLNAAAYGGQGKAYPAAVRMARAVATDPRTDPLTAERAWLVPFLIAVLRHDDAGAAGVVRDAAAGGRGSAAFDVDAARLAAANGDRPLARAMVRRAAALAPNSPLVAAARKEIGS